MSILSENQIQYEYVVFKLKYKIMISNFKTNLIVKFLNQIKILVLY